VRETAPLIVHLQPDFRGFKKRGKTYSPMVKT
jgi:hypothetical protein